MENDTIKPLYHLNCALHSNHLHFLNFITHELSGLIFFFKNTSFNLSYSIFCISLWNSNVLILMKFSSLAALKVVILTTFSAAINENTIKMTDIILMKFSPLAVLKVVILTTFSATIDENFIKMMRFSFNFCTFTSLSQCIFTTSLTITLSGCMQSYLVIFIICWLLCGGDEGLSVYIWLSFQVVDPRVCLPFSPAWYSS